jgi:Holliday junction DNA helicase RuvA
MIFQLTGRLAAKNGLLIVVDIGGIGYGIFAPMSTLSKLPEIGKEVLLHTHLIVREDAHILYGFLEEKEKFLFCELIKISGFGPKLALSILSHLSVEQFLNIIMLKNISKLTDIPGIGHKIAQRLIVEMENNINSKKFAELLSLNNSVVNVDYPLIISENVINDAQEALISLGYKQKEAIIAIRTVINNKDNNIIKTISSELLLREALKNLSKVYYD